MVPFNPLEGTHIHDCSVKHTHTHTKQNWKSKEKMLTIQCDIWCQTLCTHKLHVNSIDLFHCYRPYYIKWFSLWCSQFFHVKFFSFLQQWFNTHDCCATSHNLRRSTTLLNDGNSKNTTNSSKYPSHIINNPSKKCKKITLNFKMLMQSNAKHRNWKIILKQIVLK